MKPDTTDDLAERLKYTTSLLRSALTLGEIRGRAAELAQQIIPFNERSLREAGYET